MFCRGFLGSGYTQFGGYGSGGMFLMMGLGFLLFLGLILLVFKLIKNNSFSTLSLSNKSLLNSSLSNNSALNILNDRYAKGEIDEDEYIKKKTILNQKN